MTCHSSHSQDNASMVDGIIAVVKLGTNRTHTGLHNLGNHFSQPASFDYLYVIADETDDLAISFYHRSVVDRTEI
jgi:hypothetical protein